MREIKFRGRRKNSSEWVYGAFLAIPKLCSYIYDVQPDGQATRYLVDEDTVGQYTGLNDCKGREIYEGDIIRYKDENGRVYYENDCFGVAFYHDYATLLMVCDECEVIGNVHDNPELLK